MKNKLTREEIKDLIRLLKKVKIPAPYPVFVALCKSVPLIAIDLAIMPDKNSVLLTYRKDDFYDGWHLPGTILRYGESVEMAYKRVAREELGISILNPKFVSWFDIFFDPRDKGVALLFMVKPKIKPGIGEYFSLRRMPKKFLRSQWPEIKYLKKLSLGD